MLNQGNWVGMFFLELGATLYCDFSSDEMFEGRMAKLALMLQRKLSGGHSDTANATLSSYSPGGDHVIGKFIGSFGCLLPPVA